MPKPSGLELLGIEFETNIGQVIPPLIRNLGKFKDKHDTFLANHVGEVENFSKKIVFDVIYGTPFKPKVYVRTGRALQSIRVQLKQKSIIIDSNPNVAKAIKVSGGYAKFIAGEGDGITHGGKKIGFLKTRYGNRFTYFPRRFHVTLGDKLPDKMEKLYVRDVLKHFK